jgi:hypothetical protein
MHAEQTQVRDRKLINIGCGGARVLSQEQAHSKQKARDRKIDKGSVLLRIVTGRMMVFGPAAHPAEYESLGYS